MAGSAAPGLPEPSGAGGLAEFIEQLRLLRAYAGNPSYRTLAKKVGPLLRPPQEVTHSTVSDVFDPTRRRLNQELVIAIVRALGLSEDEVARWRAACVAAHAGLRSTGPAGVFRQLPAELATFTGRQDEIDALLKAVAGAGTVVISAIEGMAGVGKTQLAVHAAHELVRSGRFTEVQLYVNLRGFDLDCEPADPADVLDSFLRQLEVPARQIPAGLAERAAMFRDRVAEKDALVLLDNAADEAQVRELIPAGPRCLVLITSRRSLAGLDGALLHRLDVFSLAEALELLTRIVGSERVDAEPDAAEEVARLCGFLPLAVSLAAARLRSRPAWSLEQLAAQLRAGGLGAVRAGSRELRPVFELSYRELSDDAARTFRLLGLHPARGFSVGAVAALAGVSEEAARRRVAVLLDENLLQQKAADRYELHDLLYSFAIEHAAADEDPDRREEALTRLLSWYLHTAESASRAVESRQLPDPLPPHADEPEPRSFASAEDVLAWYSSERDSLAAALAVAGATGRHEIAWRLAATLFSCYHLTKDWVQWLAGYRTGLDSARALGDTAAEGRMLNGLGVANSDLWDHEEAVRCYRQAMDLGRQSGLPRQVASALNNIGNEYRALGDMESAEEAFTASVAEFRVLDDPHYLSMALTNLGTFRRDAGRPEEAVATLMEALEVERRSPQLRNEGAVLCNLGDVLVSMGRFDEARERLEEALGAVRSVGDRYAEALTLGLLAQCLEHGGQRDEARAALTEALAIFEELQAPQVAETREALAALGG